MSVRDISPKIRSGIHDDFGIDVRAKTLEGELADLQDGPGRVTEITESIPRGNFRGHLALCSAQIGEYFGTDRYLGVRNMRLSF